MAYRQYIGARYVPLYDGNWNATKNYEPLTIVDDGNGNSYTSKKDVPKGTPLTDREYWIQTSSFSGAVEQLRRDVNGLQSDLGNLQTGVSGLQTDVGDLQTGVSGLQTDVSRLTNRKLVFVGDSYSIGTTSGARVTGYPEYVRQNLKLVEGKSFFHIGQDGAGFVNAPTFLSLLNNLINGMSSAVDKSTITDVIVCGGWNDTPYVGDGTITPAVDEFLRRVEAVFPNATLHVGMIAYSISPNADLRTRVMITTQIAQQYYNVGRVANMKNIQRILASELGMMDPGGNMNHPIAKGQQGIAKAILTYLAGGQISWGVRDRIVSNLPTLNMASGVTLESGGVVYEMKKGDLYGLYLVNTSFVFANGVTNNRKIPLFTMSNNIGHGYQQPYTGGAVSGNVTRTDGKFSTFSGFLYLEGDTVYVDSVTLNADNTGFLSPSDYRALYFRSCESIIMPIDWC